MKDNLGRNRRQGRWWPTDQRAAAEVLYWPDEDLARLNTRTAELEATGLTRQTAGWAAYLEVRQARRQVPRKSRS
jgi:hypothetical protein